MPEWPPSSPSPPAPPPPPPPCDPCHGGWADVWLHAGGADLQTPPLSGVPFAEAIGRILPGCNAVAPEADVPGYKENLEMLNVCVCYGGTSLWAELTSSAGKEAGPCLGETARLHKENGQ